MLFDTLEFGPHPAGAGSQAVIRFDNGFGASVITGSTMYYSRNDAPYELGVLHGEGICLHYDNPVADGDVVGYQTKEQIEELLKRIKAFEPLENSDEKDIA